MLLFVHCDILHIRLLKFYHRFFTNFIDLNVCSGYNIDVSF